jgi:hypothetical protein
MTRPVGDNDDNVVPLRRRSQPHIGSTTVPVHDLADAVRAFGLLERCAARLQSGPLGVAGEFDGTEWPIVSLQVQLPVTEQWLDRLGHINIANWPDTRWVIRLGGARAVAVSRLNAVTRCLYKSPPGTGPLEDRLASNIGKLADALNDLRKLIAHQYPEALRAR